MIIDLGKTRPKQSVPNSWCKFIELTGINMENRMKLEETGKDWKKPKYRKKISRIRVTLGPLVCVSKVSKMYLKV